MTRYSTIALVVLGSAVLPFASGCAGTLTNMYAGGPSPGGSLYTNVNVPAQALTVATDSTATAEKTGTASAQAWFGLIAFGNAGVEAAMKDGGITKVHHVDQQITHWGYSLDSSAHKM